MKIDSNELVSYINHLIDERKKHNQEPNEFDVYAILGHIVLIAGKPEPKKSQGIEFEKAKYWKNITAITDYEEFKKAADFFYSQGCIDTEEKIRNAKPEDFGEISCQSQWLKDETEVSPQELLQQIKENHIPMNLVKAIFIAGVNWMEKNTKNTTTCKKGN